MHQGTFKGDGRIVIGIDIYQDFQNGQFRGMRQHKGIVDAGTIASIGIGPDMIAHQKGGIGLKNGQPGSRSVFDRKGVVGKIPIPNIVRLFPGPFQLPRCQDNTAILELFGAIGSLINGPSFALHIVILVLPFWFVDEGHAKDPIGLAQAGDPLGAGEKSHEWSQRARADSSPRPRNQWKRPIFHRRQGMSHSGLRHTPDFAGKIGKL